MSKTEKEILLELARILWLSDTNTEDNEREQTGQVKSQKIPADVKHRIRSRISWATVDCNNEIFEI